MATYREALDSGETILPACRTKAGCEVGDIAPERDAQNYVDGFIRAYSLESERARSEVMDHYGLLDDIELYLSCESVTRKHLTQINKKNRRK